MSTQDMLFKVCTVCHNSLPISSFHNKGIGRRGKVSVCKECKRNKSIEYRLSDAGATAIKSYNASNRRKEVHHKHRESCKYKETTKRYIESGRHDEAVKRYRQTDKYKATAERYALERISSMDDRQMQEIKKKRAEYKKSDNGKASIARCKSRRRDISKSLPSTLTSCEWEAIKKQYKFRCVYCGEKKPLTRDHIIPVVQNGPFTKYNIVPACIGCNSKKQDKPVLLQLLAMSAVAGGK
jgi:hypothetical protein